MAYGDGFYDDTGDDDGDDEDTLTEQEEALFVHFLGTTGNFQDAIQAYTDFEAQAAATFAAQHADSELPSEDQMTAFFEANPEVAHNWELFTPHLQAADGDADAALASFNKASAAAHKLVDKATEKEGLHAPSSFDEAFAQAYSEGLIGGKQPERTSGRGRLSDAVEDFAAQLAADNADVAHMRNYIRGSGYEGAR